jgi:hypothetical protein
MFFKNEKRSNKKPFRLTMQEQFRTVAEKLQNFHILPKRNMITVAYAILRKQFICISKFRHCGRSKLL